MSRTPINDEASVGASKESLLNAEQLQKTVQAAAMGLWRRGDGEAIELDAQCGVIHGYKTVASGHRQVTVQAFLEQVHPDDREKLQRSFEKTSGLGFQNVEYRFILPDGTVRGISSSGCYDDKSESPTLYGSCFDVTERTLVQQQLMLAQKMEAVGQLTAGISHNFNNILSAILPNLQMATLHVGAGGKKFLRNAEIAAERASDLVAELMVVAGRKEAQTIQALDLGLVVDRVVRICKTTFGSWVQLVLDIDTEASTILGNEGKIEQVLLNLLLNARDAFETVPISCPRVVIELEALSASEHDEPRIVLRVIDNGPGIETSIVERIFEPFFTSRDTGTGLGLATAYAIVTEHGGSISCESSPGNGAIFEVVLPAHDGVAEVVVPRVPPRFVGGSECILVVDDDALVRHVTSAALQDAGYQVVEAVGGNEAIEAHAKNDDFDLVVLDMSMPEISGDQVLSVMRGRDPRINVLIFTGVTDQRVSQLQDVAVLQKPAGVNDLLQAVREAIDTQTTI